MQSKMRHRVDGAWSIKSEANLDCSEIHHLQARQAYVTRRETCVQSLKRIQSSFRWVLKSLPCLYIPFFCSIFLRETALLLTRIRYSTRYYCVLPHSPTTLPLKHISLTSNLQTLKMPTAPTSNAATPHSTRHATGYRGGWKHTSPN